MTEVVYSNLLYQISKRLYELDVGDQLLFLCRGKVTDYGDENIQTRSLIKELEDDGFLSPDRLVLLTGILKGVEEWTLFQQVEKFEAKRKEYSCCLRRLLVHSTSSIIGVRAIFARGGGGGGGKPFAQKIFAIFPNF